MKLLLLFIFHTLTSVYCRLVSVKIKEGELLGKTYTLENNREIYAFLGVPYAEPPTGDNRFKDPKPIQPWDGIKLATSQGDICPQIPYTPGSRHRPIGNEDCLYLNVFTPKLPEYNMRSKLMNVFVYIHGGAFLFATGNEAYPDLLMHNNDPIVFVSFNYRLGVLGFHSLNHSIASGNYGMKDQVEALRWVKRNIRYFGGNPDKVTIYGCSTGAASVQYHMISPLSKGFFHRAVSSSGTVLHAWSLPRNVFENSKQLVSSLGCEDDDINETMKCLREKPVDEIVEEGYQFGEDGHLTSIPYGPVIEPHHVGAFITENPHTSLKKGNVHHVPWMIGFVENEGSFIVLEIVVNQTYMDNVNHHWYKFAPKIFSYDYDRSVSEQNGISSAIRRKYLNNKIVNKQTVKNLFQAVGDRHIFCGAMAATKLHSSSAPKNMGTFCYKLIYRGARSASDLYDSKNTNYGVCHSDDLSYIIKYGDGKSNNKNDSDMSKLLTSSIINFMENGNPSTTDIEWESISKEGNVNCLVIYSYTYQRMEDIENRANNQFWKDRNACES